MSASPTSVSTIQPISDLKIVLQNNSTTVPLSSQPSISPSQQQQSKLDDQKPTTSQQSSNNSHDSTSTDDFVQLTSTEDSTIDQNVFDLESDISPAIAISDGELAYFHAARYILRSHSRLNDDDIQYASNYISSFYSHSHNIIYETPNADNVLTDPQLIMFLVYADQTGICKFALTFNEELDSAIKTKDNTAFKRILLGPKEMFIELYDNTFLSTEDRDFITRLIARESFAIMLALELLKKKILNLDSIDDTCTSSTFTFQSEKEGTNVRLVALATKCYDEVCIQDAKILADDEARATMSRYEKIPDSVFTIDKPSSSDTPQVYCFHTLDLISAVTENVPINPKSGEPFSSYSLQLITQRFRKEIDMYRRYRQIKSGK